ncbi:TPA: hypothetical protein ACVU4T_003876 [Vibrio parahaemolyticus]
MKITKAHIQIGILVIGGLVVATLWLAKNAPASTAPRSIETTKPSVVNAGKVPPPDNVIRKPKPKSVSPALVIDAKAKQLIDRSETLALAKLDANIAEQQARARKATRSEPSQERAGYVPAISVIDDYAPPRTPSKPRSLKAIDRFTLSGLFVDEQEASAYLSFDGGAPVRVREGQSIQGVRITHINANGVRLMQGIQAKVLEGGL